MKRRQLPDRLSKDPLRDGLLPQRPSVTLLAIVYQTSWSPNGKASRQNCLSVCWRKVEMSPGAQSRNDTPCWRIHLARNGTPSQTLGEGGGVTQHHPKALLLVAGFLLWRTKGARAISRRRRIAVSMRWFCNHHGVEGDISSFRRRTKSWRFQRHHLPCPMMVRC
jgi:hypothetical protein